MGEAPQPAAPTPGAVLRMLGELRRGSAADAPMKPLAALRQFIQGTPADARLTMKDVDVSETYLDLWNARVRPGDPAPDFELERLDGGGTVRLSAYRKVSPVALIFGSYT